MTPEPLPSETPLPKVTATDDKRPQGTGSNGDIQENQTGSTPPSRLVSSSHVDGGGGCVGGAEDQAREEHGKDSSEMGANVENMEFDEYYEYIVGKPLSDGAKKRKRE